MSQHPKVTIGVPVYNGERFLANALDAILQQTFGDFEIVISDNGSSDSTPQICRKYLAQDDRIRYVRHQRTVNPVGSFNRAFAEARGAYFTWTAVDDIRPPDAIAALVAALESTPGAVMAHGPVIADRVRECAVERIDHAMDLSGRDAARRIRTYTRQMQYNAMLYGLYRRDALIQTIFRQHPGHDYLMGLQMCLLGPIAYTSIPMLIYRHVWGETDNPMYRLQPVTARDLLLYRGVRRRKCWISLLLGTFFLLRMRHIGFSDRLRGAAVHLAGFATRFRSHLVAEIFFLTASPAMWAFAPFAPASRRLKRALVAHGLSVR